MASKLETTNYQIGDLTIPILEYVIKLGTGVGITGIIASKYCKFIVLTDAFDNVLDLLQRNVDSNNCNSSSTLVRKLFWGKPIEHKEQSDSTQIPEKFDVLMASDVVYEKECIVPLWESIDRYLSKSSDSYLLISHGSRFEELDALFEATAIEKGFERTENLGSSVVLTKPLVSPNPLNLWVFKRKQ